MTFRRPMENYPKVVAFTFDIDGLPVYPLDRPYFSPSHDKKDMTTDQAYILSFLK